MIHILFELPYPDPLLFSVYSAWYLKLWSVSEETQTNTMVHFFSFYYYLHSTKVKAVYTLEEIKKHSIFKPE